MSAAGYATRKLEEHTIGRVRYQAMWEKLLAASLSGLGIGGGASVAQSGEAAFLAGFVAASRGLSRRALCLDVGANVGLWSQTLLDLARRASLETDVIAFEPSQAACRRLRERFAGIPAVTVESFALGDRAHESTLYSDKPASGLASLYARRLGHLGIRLLPSETVAVRTLDHYCSERGIDRVDLLKLDVEGSELAVLCGGEGMLRRRRIGVIQFEFGGCNIDSRTYFQDFWYLLSDRYLLFRVVRDGLWPIESYSETLESFTTTNYVAILRSA